MSRQVPDWFRDARLGLFAHFGPYSVANLEPSWPMVGGIPVLPFCQSLTVGEYDALTAGFAPPPGAPAAWAELAARCGVDYAVLTTKHHDGFTLWPSEHSDHGIHTTAPGRDLVREYAEAMRSAGIRVGLYFSLPDWHHPSYPAFTDEMRPYPALGYPRPPAEVWEHFLADQRGQLDELLTNYGQIDLLWFDGGWERTPEEWRSAELEAFILERQPDIAINDRCPGIAGYSSMLWEGTVPLDAPAEPWEACLPLDDSWGALEIDAGRKSVGELVGLVSDAAAGGGRLLVNISPLGDGSIPRWQEEVLSGLALWLARHRPAISAAPSPALAGHHAGPVTAQGSSVYLNCPALGGGTVVLRSVRGAQVTGARVLGTGEPIAWRLRISALERMLNGANPVCDVVFEVPPAAAAASGPATVLALEVSGPLA